jgi:hypothetical protein
MTQAANLGALGTNVNSSGDVSLTTGVTGTLPKTNLPAGCILQVVSATKTDVQSTTSQTYADITGLSVSITPSSSSNKILVFYSVAASNSGGSTAIQLVRDSTAISVGTSATGSQVAASLGNYYNTDANSVSVGSGNYLDSPATTAATTYKLQFRVGDTGGTGRINMSFNQANAAYTLSLVSSITVMEVAG